MNNLLERVEYDVRDIGKFVPNRHREVDIEYQLSDITVYRDGTYTVAIISDFHGFTGVGVSKRNPNFDDHNPVVGDTIALTRAYKRWRDAEVNEGERVLRGESDE